MTFTDHGMRDKRWTTRSVTLDELQSSMMASASTSAMALNGPADGLSLAEATRLHGAVTSVLRACERACACIEHVRANDLT
jgi:hypothetical protein